MRRQIVLAEDGGKKNMHVLATIYGKLAVHEAMNGDWWTVTHIKTGTAVAHYSDESIAHKFAAELNANIDMDALAQGLVESVVLPKFVDQLKWMKARRQHASWINIGNHPSVEEFRSLLEHES